MDGSSSPWGSPSSDSWPGSAPYGWRLQAYLGARGSRRFDRAGGVEHRAGRARAGALLIDAAVLSAVGAFLVALPLGGLWCAIVGTAYYTMMVWRRGATLGKTATGLRIVDSRTLGPISFVSSLSRMLTLDSLSLMPATFVLFGWIAHDPASIPSLAIAIAVPASTAIWLVVAVAFVWRSPNRVAIHDHLANTLVIKVSERLPQSDSQGPPQAILPHAPSQGSGW